MLRWLALVCVACTAPGPTFVRACRFGDRYSYPRAGEVASTACDRPEEIVWAWVPLVVEVEPGLADYRASVHSAVMFWNREVGPLFEEGQAMSADVFVESGDAGPHLGQTYHMRVGARLIATIEVNRPGDLLEAYLVLAHELGHVLGLAHDRRPGSVMTPGVPVTGGAAEFEFPRIFVTPEDRDALRARYFPPYPPPK